MNLRRNFLWVLLFGTLLPFLLVVVDVSLDWHPISRFFSFNRYLLVHWFVIAVSVWMLMLPLGSIHALTNTANAWWQRIMWVVSFLLLGPIAIPVYCLVGLRKPASVV